MRTGGGEWGGECEERQGWKEGGERERGRGEREREREKGGWHSRPLATQTSERFSGSSVTT